MMGESKLWISFNYACVIAAYAMLGLSLIFMPVNLATKGYVAMGVLFLSGSLVTLVRTLQEQRINAQFTSKVERAKQEKLLSEFVGS